MKPESEDRLSEMREAGVVFDTELCWVLNRWNLHHGHGRKRAHHWVVERGYDPLDPQHGCVKCIRIARDLEHVLGLTPNHNDL